MWKPFGLFATLGVIACDDVGFVGETDATIGGDTDVDEDSDTDATADSDTNTDGDGCDAEVDTIAPIDGALNVAVDAAITATFSEAVAEGDWSLSLDGVAGQAVLAGDGLSATFTPDAAFENNTDYAVAATACESVVETGFRTIPAPLEGDDLIGRTYALEYDTVTNDGDPANVTWLAPNSAGLMSSYIEFDYLLTQVTASNEDTLEVSGAIGEKAGPNVVQAACYSIIEYENVDFSNNPTLAAGPTNFSIPNGDSTLTIEDMTFVGTLTEDGDALTDIELTGRIDTRPLDASLGFDVCELVSVYGDTCIDCGDGQPECLEIWLIADIAMWKSGLDIDETYDPALDASCY